MIEVYKIFEDTIQKQVATIYYNRETKQYSSEVLIKKYAPLPFTRFKYGAFPGECPHPPAWCLENWLKDRVIPENRMMLKEILHTNGIYEYDWRVLIKLNHGRSVCDTVSVEVEEVETVDGIEDLEKLTGSSGTGGVGWD